LAGGYHAATTIAPSSLRDLMRSPIVDADLRKSLAR
jgi:hypothetical protein